MDPVNSKSVAQFSVAVFTGCPIFRCPFFLSGCQNFRCPFFRGPNFRCPFYHLPIYYYTKSLSSLPSPTEHIDRKQNKTLDTKWLTGVVWYHPRVHRILRQVIDATISRTASNSQTKQHSLIVMNVYKQHDYNINTTTVNCYNTHKYANIFSVHNII